MREGGEALPRWGSTHERERRERGKEVEALPPWGRMAQ